MKKETVSLDYFVVALQKKCDAVAGLKVQVKVLKDTLKEMEQAYRELSIENQRLVSKLTELNHDYQKLKNKYEPEMPDNDFRGKIRIDDGGNMEESDD